MNPTIVEPPPQEMLLEGDPTFLLPTILNWLFGLLGLICVITLLICFCIAVIFAVKEAGRQLDSGQKHSYHKTIIASVIGAVALLGLIIIIVAWGVSLYVTQNLSIY